MEIKGFRRPMGGIPDKNAGSNGRVILLTATDAATRNSLAVELASEAAGLQLSQHLNAKSRLQTQKIRRVNSLLAQTHVADDSLASLKSELGELANTPVNEGEERDYRREQFNKKAEQVYKEHAALLARQPFSGGSSPQPFLTEVRPEDFERAASQIIAASERVNRHRDRLVSMAQQTPARRDLEEDSSPPLRDENEAWASAMIVSRSIVAARDEALLAQANIDADQAKLIL